MSRHKLNTGKEPAPKVMCSWPELQVGFLRDCTIDHGDRGRDRTSREPPGYFRDLIAVALQCPILLHLGAGNPPNTRPQLDVAMISMRCTTCKPPEDIQALI